MTAIEDYSDVLNDNMIAAWPRVAAALEGLDCTLMGGTAVAMMLRHRHSHDLDFMTITGKIQRLKMREQSIAELDLEDAAKMRSA